MLPFDTLLQPFTLEKRLYIASTYQFGLFSLDSYPSSIIQQSSLADTVGHSGMKLGFLSYDFNDHPTAHLVEGLFTTIKEIQPNQSTSEVLYSSISTYAYCYGNYDNTTFRHKLVEVS